jgi:hypothetical protein
MLNETDSINNIFKQCAEVVVVEPTELSQPDTKILNKYKNYMISAAALEEDKANSSLTQIDSLLELEKKALSTEPWNKLDKRLKIQKLHAYAEKYGRENAFSAKDVKGLKQFFSECLAKDKMAKVRDVEYDKTTGIIQGIPGLVFNSSTRAFTLKNLDKKVSTLKSLTPKKTIPIVEQDSKNE